MSEFHVQVVQLGKIGKHPNADNLSITNIHGGYPVIFKNGDFKEGDLAVYVPVDALVPLDRPEFSFLQKADKPKTHERIKAKKLRGIFSMGLLVKIEQNPCLLGVDVRDRLGITKYESPVEIATGGDAEKDPGFIPTYTDIEGLRKYKSVLVPGEEVILTEKIHGANARYVWHEDRLWCASHRQIKAETESSMWWRAATKYNLQEKLKLVPGTILYGEVYGQVQDLKYGAKPGELFLRFFDAYSLASGRYLDYDEFTKVLDLLGLEAAPLLYKGPWDEKFMTLCEGRSTIADNVREGFVVKPVKERWDNKIGRVILKMVGEGYLLR